MIREVFDLIFRFQDGGSEQKLKKVERSLAGFSARADRADRKVQKLGKTLGSAPQKAVAGFGKAAKAIGEAGRQVDKLASKSKRAEKEVDDLGAAGEKAAKRLKGIQGVFTGLRKAISQGGFGRGVLGGFIGFAALGGANQLGGAIKDLVVGGVQAQARAEQLSISLDVLAKNFFVSRSAMVATEVALKKFNFTTVQSREAIQLFTRAGASQKDVVTLVGVAMDAAARKGLNLSDAIGILAEGVAKAEPEILDNLGIIIKMSEVYDNFARSVGVSSGEQLTAAQRSRALVFALTEQAEKGGEFEAIAGTLSRTMIDLDLSTARFKESLGTFFTPAAESGLISLLGFLNDINAALDEANAKTKFRSVVQGQQRKGPQGFFPTAFDQFNLTGNLDTFIAADIAGRAPGAPGRDGVPEFARRNRKDIDNFQSELDRASKDLASSRKALEKAVERASTSAERLLSNTQNEGLSAVERVDAEFRTALERLSATNSDITRIQSQFDPLARIRDFQEASGTTPTGAQIDQIKKIFDPKLADPFIAKIRVVQEKLTVAFDLRKARAVIGTLPEITESFNVGQIDKFDASLRRVRENLDQDFRTPQGLEEFQSRLGDLLFTLDLANQEIEADFARAAARQRVRSDDFDSGDSGLERNNKRVFKRLEEAGARRKILADAAAASVKKEADSRKRILGFVLGEAEAAGKSAAIRIRAAQAEFEIRARAAQTENERLELALSTIALIRDAQLDADSEVAEERRRQIDDFREAVGSAFDAGIRGGAVGLEDFLQSQVLGIQRILTQNLGEELFTFARDTVNLESPGQRNSSGGLNVLGRLLKGTPFGTDPVRESEQQQTAAIKASTAAEIELRNALDLLRNAIDGTPRGGAVANQIDFGFRAAGSLTGLPIGQVLDVVKNTAEALERSTDKVSSSVNKFVASQDEALVLNLSRPAAAELTAAATQAQTAKAAADAAEAAKEVSSKLKSGLGTAGGVGFAAAAGAFGVRAGLQKGGISGGLEAGGSAVAAAASIANVLGAFEAIPVIGAFIQIGAQVAQIVGALSGGRTREDLDREVAEALEANKFELPPAQSREFNLSGQEEDFNILGRARTIVINDNRSISIDAIDAKSLAERGNDILDALLPPIQAGHPVVGELQQQFLGG